MQGNGIQGPASDIKIMSDYMQKSRQRLNQALAANTGHSAEKIARDTERDHFMSAQEALEYGLIDSILIKYQYRKNARWPRISSGLLQQKEGPPGC